MVVGAAAIVFKAKPEMAMLPKELAAFVKTLKGAYKTKTENGSITWTGANSSQLRKVGSFYVAIEKANVSFQFALQIRNKLLEAYQEIMRMSV